MSSIKTLTPTSYQPFGVRVCAQRVAVSLGQSWHSVVSGTSNPMTAPMSAGLTGELCPMTGLQHRSLSARIDASSKATVAVLVVTRPDADFAEQDPGPRTLRPPV